MSQRIQKIKDTYLNQLQHKLHEEKIEISLDSAWDILISADSSPNKKNFRWLVETYLNNGYCWQDIENGPESFVYNTLREFDRNKSIMDENNRSLNTYKNIDELYETIFCYVNRKSNRSLKKSMKEEVYSETFFISDTEDLRIICPLTPGSAAWWSRGTKWCTSGNIHFYEQYAKLTPLFIIIFNEYTRKNQMR